jgi:putative membrane protein
MKRFLVRVIVNAVAFWLTTLVIGAISANKFTITPYGAGGTTEFVVTLLLVALIFGLVNGIIGNFIRIVAFPLYVLTLGLLALVVNSLLLLFVSWISQEFLGYGLFVEDFWWGVLGAIILGLIAWVLSLLLRPLTQDRKKR